MAIQQYPRSKHVIILTDYGRTESLKKQYSLYKKAHLFTDDGEFKGRGYSSKTLEIKKWKDGVYPDLVWDFEAGTKVEVIGYYVTDVNEKIIFSQQFEAGDIPEKLIIEHRGDRIRIQIAVNILAKPRNING